MEATPATITMRGQPHAPHCGADSRSTGFAPPTSYASVPPKPTNLPALRPPPPAVRRHPHRNSLNFSGAGPGYHGYAWPIACPRSWGRLTECRVLPQPSAPLYPLPPHSPTPAHAPPPPQKFSELLWRLVRRAWRHVANHMPTHGAAATMSKRSQSHAPDCGADSRSAVFHPSRPPLCTRAHQPAPPPCPPPPSSPRAATPTKIHRTFLEASRASRATCGQSHATARSAGFPPSHLPFPLPPSL